MQLQEVITLLNPWWKEGNVPLNLKKEYKRKIFPVLIKRLEHRQIIVLSGLRRVGKTTLLYQTIADLLQNNNPLNVFYFNFDKQVEQLISVLDAYTAITSIDWKKEEIFIFLDEMVKLPNWARELKLIYDAFPNIHFIVSSSSSMQLETEALSFLGGRYFLLTLMPLHFVEFLELTGNTKVLKNPALFQKEMQQLFQEYTLRSFPEIVTWSDPLLVKDYLRTTIIDKIVKLDLQEKYTHLNKDLLFTLLDLFYGEPGTYIDYDSFSKKFRISKKTLFDHIFYLSSAYLIRHIKNFRPSISASSRKMQRIYPYWWSLAYCYTDNNDKIMENAVISYADALYYWREQSKEIDMLLVKGKEYIPIEVKNKKELHDSDASVLFYFLEKYKVSQGFIIYFGEQKELKRGNVVVHCI
ncbi:MAG: ATP-binding protein, partial [Nanoarchaeota archaeon]